MVRKSRDSGSRLAIDPICSQRRNAKYAYFYGQLVLRLSFLAPELQVSCLNALGHVEGSLNDAFHLAETCKTLYTVYTKYLPEIARCIIVSKRENKDKTSNLFP